MVGRREGRRARLEPAQAALDRTLDAICGERAVGDLGGDEGRLAQVRALGQRLPDQRLAAPLHFQFVGLGGVDERHADLLHRRDDRLLADVALHVPVGAADRPGPEADAGDLRPAAEEGAGGDAAAGGRRGGMGRG